MALKYADLVDQLPEIRDMGYVLTKRAGDTGIGKTLEDLLHIQENNFAGPNGHNTELKAGRRGSDSMLTLFTKSPLPPRINVQLLEKFGRPIKNGKSLHSTVIAPSRNTLYGEPGFQIHIKPSRIELSHSEYGDIQTPYWNRTDLEAAFTRKYPGFLLYVKADRRGSGESEEFHFNEAMLMSRFHFDRFIELLQQGKIKVDIRLGQYPDGRLHDHGTGFRVMPDDLELCFIDKEKVL